MLQAIKESNINYGKDYDIYTYYHYDNGNIVGIVYGWFYDRYLYFDIVFVSAEYRGKGIATSMLEKVIQETKTKTLIALLLIWCNIKINIYLQIFLLILVFVYINNITSYGKELFIICRCN